MKAGLFFLLVISGLWAMGSEPVPPPSFVTTEEASSMPTLNIQAEIDKDALHEKILNKMNADIDIALAKIELPEFASPGERVQTQIILPTGLIADEVIVVIGPYYQQKLNDEQNGIFSGEIVIPLETPKSAQDIAYHIRTEFHKYQLHKQLVVN